MRKAAADAMGRSRDPKWVPEIHAAYGGERLPQVRVALVRALGQIGGPGVVDALVKVLSHEPDAGVKEAAAESLVSQPDLTQHLPRVFKREVDSEVRSQVIELLVEGAETGAAVALRELLWAEDDDTEVRMSAASALPRLTPQDAVVSLAHVAADPDRELRLRVVQELGKAVVPVGREQSESEITTAIDALTKRLVTDDDSIIRAYAARGLSNIDAGPKKVAALLRSAATANVLRGQLDAREAVKALDASDFGSDDLSLDEHLIGKALARDEGDKGTVADSAILGIIADLLIASAEGNVTTVADRIKRYQKRTGASDPDLQDLRVEVGGASALNPLMRVLEQNLQTNFQKPIQELNDATQNYWTQTVRSARFGFKVRNAMSMIVFAVGMVLLGGSVWVFLAGDQKGNELWGPGVSFVAGLGSVLLTVYSGPLKDIRESVADLASANAAYIGYVHSVLQISHTFTRRYLEQTPTFEDMRISTGLITDSMTATVAALRDTEPPDRSTEELQRRIEALAAAQSHEKREHEANAK